MVDPGFRTERDSMGEVQVPKAAYYGAQTQRALENFPISGIGFPPPFIHALGWIKLCAAAANEELGLLEARLATAIRQAAQEVIDGKLDREFVVDIFQTGSGTSTNMNANEVIANRALEILKKPRGSKEVHANDHVNMCQSSNDVIKIGRTHLADATPIRLGQEFGGYARQIALSIERIKTASAGLEELPLGGTAIGTGINAHPEFARKAIAKLSELTGLQFREAENHFEAQAARDAAVQVSGSLKTLAVSLSKIANDLRWLASGPRCGIAEIILPDLQPGSSIMPGKVNPVLCESVLQVAAHVIGCDATITLCGQAGNFELNTMMPIMSLRLLEAIQFSANVVNLFSDKCIDGIVADRARCQEMIERSLAMVTALAPVIGYESAAKIAQEALATGRTVREVAQEKKLLAKQELDKLLDPWGMTEPGVPGRN